MITNTIIFVCTKWFDTVDLMELCHDETISFFFLNLIYILLLTVIIGTYGSQFIYITHTCFLPLLPSRADAVSRTAHVLCHVIMECHSLRFLQRHMCTDVSFFRAGCGTWGHGGPCWWRGGHRSWARRRARGLPTTTLQHTRCLHAPHR